MLSREEILSALPNRLHDLLDRHLPELASAPALHERGACLTYGELAEAVERMQAQLALDGIRGGDRVMLVGENCRLLVVWLLALSRLDAWAVVINARLSAKEIDTIRQHCGARRLLFTSAASTDALRHAEQAGATRCESGALGHYHIGPLNNDCQPEPVDKDPSGQVAAMIYTTGTTGAPKGVMLTHRNLLYIAFTAGLLRELDHTDRVYAVLPISHVFGLTAVCLSSLFAGAALQLEARFDAREVARALQEDRITLIQGVPAMFAKLLECVAADQAPAPLPHLRFMYAGGSPLDATLKAAVEQRYGVPLHNGYGLTECSPTVSQTRIEDPRHDTSVGRPIPGIEIRLMNSERNTEVAVGDIGELWVRGPNVMKGYYRAQAQTADVLTTDGWLNTGDLFRQDADGALFVVGRSKELIIRSGFNVYPPEVETALNAFPGVILSAVVGREVEGNEEVVAFVQVARPEHFDLPALEAFLVGQLSPYKRPSHIRVLESLPAAATGKVLKHELKKIAMGFTD